MRHPLPIACALLLAVAAAPSARAEGGKEGKDKPIVNRIDLSKVGLPIVWRGRLVNYVFVAVRLNLAPGKDGQMLRPKEPYIRDALSRAGHRTPFVDPADLSRVDERALVPVLLRDAQRIAGPGMVVGAEILSQQPRRRLPRPAPDAPAGRPITP